MQARKAALVLGVVLAMVVGLLGCFNIGSARFPAPSSGFQPKKEYAAPYDRVWTAINQMLQSERINVASSDKDGGRIVTDYVQGETQSAVLAYTSSRYKYNISLERAAQERTRVNIIATLESSGDNAPYHDVSKDNTQIVQRLEFWLYERIERSI
jgi:hypothetical protein